MSKWGFYGNQTLTQALREHGLSVRSGVLFQVGRRIGPMTSIVGWALIHLLDDNSTENYPRCTVYEARKLLSQLDRPLQV